MSSSKRFNSEDENTYKRTRFDLVTQNDYSTQYVEVEESTFGDMSFYITVTPIENFNTFDDLILYDSISQTLRSRMKQSLLRNGVSLEKIIESDNFEVFMKNIDDSSQKASTERSLKLSEITSKLLLDLFARATNSGSNPDLRLSSVYWRIYINPLVFERGASDEEDIKHKGLFRPFTPTECFPYNLKELGCAAISISLGLKKKETKRNYFTSKKFTRFIFETQEKLSFKDPLQVSFQEIIDNTIIAFKDYRAALFIDSLKKTIVGKGAEYIKNNNYRLDKTLFIYYDSIKKHYRLVSGPQYFVSIKNSGCVLCLDCCVSYNAQSNSGSCECGKTGRTRPYVFIQCPQCGEEFIESHKKHHSCGETQCKWCHVYYNENKICTHTCPLKADFTKTSRIFYQDSYSEDYKEYVVEDKLRYDRYIYAYQERMGQLIGYEPVNKRDPPKQELWAWDIESKFITVPGKTTKEFEVDEITGRYVLDQDKNVKYVEKQILAHVPVFIHAQNVFTKQKRSFNSMKDFIIFAENYDKKNPIVKIFWAHNSSGYDSKLLMEAAFELGIDINPLMRGTKILNLKLKHSTFMDTMLHLRGSLKSLGESFKLDGLKKGYFPYLYCTDENIRKHKEDRENNILTFIPEKHYFGLDSFKSKKDWDDFNLWHDSQKDIEWNFEEELESYCVNDVSMLSNIMEIYHRGIIELISVKYKHLAISPWFSPTMAGWVHQLQLVHLNYGANIYDMTADEVVEYAENTWCSLQVDHHYYASKAMRGGMTNICKYISEEPMHYQDIQSSYPTVQMLKECVYPVGTPTMEVFNKKYYPCTFCAHKPFDECNHSLNSRIEQQRKNYKQLKIKDYTLKPDMTQIEIENYCRDFFGIITIDCIPPRNLYHPLIQKYDIKEKKVIGTLLPIIEETIPSNILHEAIKIGYKITRVHRGDRYKCRDSIWRNGCLGQLYIAKMRNAGKIKLEDQERVKNTFMEKFNIDLGDMNLFEKNDVLKAMAKGPVTAAWGKLGESTDHDQTTVFRDNSQKGYEFFIESKKNNINITDIKKAGENYIINSKVDRERVRPNLHKGYMPAAVFVTAYGRIALWKQLVFIDPPGTLGKHLRVIMYDTDSILYTKSKKYLDDQGNEQILEQGPKIPEGDCLGDWETEKIEKEHSNGIYKFYSVGPKSYAIIYGDKKELLKLKGATIKHAHGEMITADHFKEMVLLKTKISMPQMSFDYRKGELLNAITTRHFLKDVQFNEQYVKGTFNNEDFRGYPFGYQE